VTCPCNGKTDAPHVHTTRPTEFCPFCAEKHVGTADSLAREYGYAAPNLGRITGELVAAAWHLIEGGKDALALAEKIRDLRHKIQHRELQAGQADFDPILVELDRMIRDFLSRPKVEAQPPAEKVPLLVPLAFRPGNRDDELKILLRSAHANARDLGEVIVACSGPPPEWLREGNGLRTIQVADSDRHNKDANIARKLLAMLELAAPAAKACFSADDNAFLQPVYLSEMPLLHTKRSLAKIRQKESLSQWAVRLMATLEAFPWLPFDFDAHVPVVFGREAAAAAIRATDFASPPGKTIVTAIVGGIYPDRAPESVLAATWKETAESAIAGAMTPLAARLLGYNDDAAKMLIPRLFKRFPSPSPWEK